MGFPPEYWTLIRKRKVVTQQVAAKPHEKVSKVGRE